MMMCAFTVFGCGPAAQAPRGDAQAPEGLQSKGADDGDRRILNAGATDLRVNDSDGNILWSISGESTRVGIGSDEGSQAFLYGVSGEVYQDGKPASQFESQEGKANTDSRTFKLLKRVVVTSLSADAKLEADELEWLPDKELFVARGSVTVKRDDWTFGPTPELYARADLKAIGSSEQLMK